MTDRHQQTADCIRCGRPVEPPYRPSVAALNGRKYDGPVCDECIAVHGDDFFNAPGTWAGGVPLEDEAVVDMCCRRCGSSGTCRCHAEEAE